MPNIDWEVVVFDEDEINAFADPNGKIGVFNGILKVAETPDALAAVIGHEIAHATARPCDGPGAQERTPGDLGDAGRCRYRRQRI